MFLSVISRNLNWEIVTKNLVTVKRQDGMGLVLWRFTEKSDF